MRLCYQFDKTIAPQCESNLQDEVRGERKVSAKRYTPAIVSVQSVGGRPAGRVRVDRKSYDSNAKVASNCAPRLGKNNKVVLWAHQRNMSKKIVIMRGIPGSGKSTYVRENFDGAWICSADDFFYYWAE